MAHYLPLSGNTLLLLVVSEASMHVAVLCCAVPPSLVSTTHGVLCIRGGINGRLFWFDVLRKARMFCPRAKTKSIYRYVGQVDTRVL